MVTRLVGLICAALILATHAQAHVTLVGPLKVGPAWTQAATPGSDVSAGYLVVTNTGPKADRLVDVEIRWAAKSELHQTLTVDGISAARTVKAVPIPPDETMELKPDGFHITFVDLIKPLTVGDTVTGTLVFERVGRVPVTFHVEEVGATRRSPD